MEEEMGQLCEEKKRLDYDHKRILDELDAERTFAVGFKIRWIYYELNVFLHNIYQFFFRLLSCANLNFY